MEINKKSIRMNYVTGKDNLNVTIDDDFNVPDSKPDIEKRIREQGRVIIDKVKALEEKINVQGKLIFKFLYASKEGCESMEGSIDFDETQNMEGLGPQDILRASAILEDISVNVVNSRKISVRAVITVNVTAEGICEKNALIGLNEPHMQMKKKTMNVLNLAASKKDIFRIREEISLPNGRPNASEILWSELAILNTDIRAMEREIGIKGELYMFCLYKTEEEDESQAYYDEILPFSGKIEVGECKSEMYPDVLISVTDLGVALKPDINGELRMFAPEAALNLDIKIYDEEEYEILEDAYSTNCDTQLVRENMEYESFVVKNGIKFRLKERYKLPEGAMQIISATGRINPSYVNQNENGVLMEGAVHVDLLFTKGDDKDRIGYAGYDLPFSELCEMTQMDDDYIYKVEPGNLQITAVMTGGGEADIKCSVGMNLMVSQKHSESIITDISLTPFAMDAYKNQPGITGYITNDRDTMWKIAKKHHTTVKNIMENNNLASDEVHNGMKLLIFKEILDTDTNPFSG